MRTEAAPDVSRPRIGGGHDELMAQVQYAKGVGPRRAELLAKLGIVTVKDALYYFPTRYEDRSAIKKMARVVFGAHETVSGEVVRAEVVTTARRRMKIFELTVGDGTGYVTGLWFNQPFMQRVFKVGQRVLLYGVTRVDGYHSRVVIEGPEYEVVTDEDSDDPVHTGRVVPIYGATAGISVRNVRSIMKGLVDHYAPMLDEFLPDGFLARFRIPALPDAVREAHFPTGETDVSLLNSKATRAQKRLIFDEFFLMELGLASMRKGRVVAGSGIRLKGDGRLTGKLISGLPFKLTPAQDRVIGEIWADMERDAPMNRLLQGDVGSGKTIVALSAIVKAAEAGYQSALMAPTEILAEQHYLNIKDRVESLGLTVALVTSSVGKKKKQAALDAVREGSADLLVGTHSVIQGGVEFSKLGLAVIDEQHRFGVSQRAALKSKGKNPDIIVMTATPIPRTLAMTAYGDLDVSTIDSMPEGRTPVMTKLFDDKGRAEAYRLVKKEIAEGGQAYIVFPLVEESEKSDLKAAKEGAEIIASEILPGVKVGLLHGRMKPAEKEAVMGEFRKGDVKALVATTVVEVGVDVPNATVMVIEHAERFGLAQLHQLRGRVGRSSRQSYCALIAYDYSETSRARLMAMLKTTSGFDIAEADLRLRGPGEFLGTRQSGLPDLILGDIIRDTKILSAARDEAFAIIDKDPDLKAPGMKGLKAALVERWGKRLSVAAVG